MYARALLILLGFLCAIAVQSAYMPAEPKTRLDPARVLVMYDASYTGDEDLNGVQDSLQLAQFYADARSIPSANLLPVTWIDQYSYTFDEFKATWLGPLTQHLDEIGSSSIDVLAVLWPLPTAFNAPSSAGGRLVSIDSTLMRPYEYYSGSYSLFTTLGYDNPYHFPNPTFAPDIARFSHASPGLAKSYLVSRIDGPGGLVQKYNMITNAIYADKYVNTDAFFGTAYVDTRGTSSSKNLTQYATLPGVATGAASDLAESDYGIAYGASYFANRGLPYKWENSGKLIGDNVSFVDGTPATTAPRAMFYFGWYSYNKYYDIYDWLPGSYASDLDSINFGYSVRNHFYSVFGTQSLYHGATTAVGAVSEPYTSGHPRIPVPPYMLLQGYSWAEAVTASTPYLAWNSIAFGDPLYQPFADKQLVVDTHSPILGPVSIVYNNKTGVAVSFSLEGIESAKLTLWYGVISPRENFVKSRHYQTYFREPFADLRGSTTYKYQLELEDPVGNKFMSAEYSFTTVPQRPYYGVPQSVPAEIFCNTFDLGGEGIASHDLVGNGGSTVRPDTGMQVYTTEDKYIFDVFNGEWMKWTIHANYTGRYLLELKHKALEGLKMALLTFVDGVQVLGPYNVTVVDNLYVTLGSVVLAEGDHVIKIKATQIVGTYPYQTPSKAGDLKRLRFTLTDQLTDDAGPVLNVTSSTSDDRSFIEHVSFSDDIGVSRVTVAVNGQAVSYTLYELDVNGAFTFYFDTTSTYNVTITVHDFFNRSASHFIFYQTEPDPVPPTAVPFGAPQTPESSVNTPGKLGDFSAASSMAGTLLVLILPVVALL